MISSTRAPKTNSSRCKRSHIQFPSCNYIRAVASGDCLLIQATEKHTQLVHHTTSRSARYAHKPYRDFKRVNMANKRGVNHLATAKGGVFPSKPILHWAPKFLIKIQSKQQEWKWNWTSWQVHDHHFWPAQYIRPTALVFCRDIKTAAAVTQYALSFSMMWGRHVTMATCAIVDLIKIRTTQKQFSHYMSNPDVADKLGGYSKCHMVLCNLMATRIRSRETNKRWRWRRLHLVNLNSIRRFIQGKAILIDVNCRNFKSLVDNPLNRLWIGPIKVNARYSYVNVHYTAGNIRKGVLYFHGI